jgi:chaperonin cofactor prefoldin
MAVDEQQARIRRSLEEKLGVEEAAFLVDRPVGGWSSLVTTEELDRRLEAFETRLDARFEAIEARFEGRFESIEGRFEGIEGRFEGIDHRFESLRHELRADFRDHTNRLILWIVPTIFAGIAAMGGAAALIRG